RLVWEARRIVYAKLLALLLALKISSDARTLTLLQEVIVKVERCLVITSHFLELLFHDGTSLHAYLQLTNLLLNLALPVCQISDTYFVLAQLRAELLNLRWLAHGSLRSTICRRITLWCCCQLFL